MQSDTTNTIFQQAVAFVTQTNKSLFLTGRAGTGKTTFLKYIRDNCFKKMAIVAPTGVAAINAGGVTIHSFFQLPFGMYLPAHPAAWGNIESNIYNKNQLLGKLRLSSSKRELIRELDLLIIDEVSMVRSDLLDAVDTVLRSVRRRHEEPFGGVQMLYIGDLFQLPPVVKKMEWKIYHEFYKSPFFFNAKAVHEAPPVFLSLKKIYRQSDPAFIRILNNVRNNCCSEADLRQLHLHYRPGYMPSGEEGYITLTSHNYMADAINREQLERLPGKAYHFEAEIDGDFSQNAYPVSQVLQLKEGAQIMFVKNDKGEERRYYNGKIGIVQRIEKKGKQIFVSFPGEEGVLELSVETWRNIRYKYEQERDEITEEELGTFKQFPIRLAWAVTIHKSQGLTFEKAIIDAGSSFAPGQVYVALSRLTSLDGLILRSTINPGSIMTDEQVLAFSAGELEEESLKEEFELAQRDYLRQSLLEAFGWKKLLEKSDQIIQDTAKRSIPNKPNEMEWLHTLQETTLQQYEVAEKFKAQLDKLLAANDEASHVRMHERTTKAAEWFSKGLQEKCITAIQDHIRQQKVKSKTKKYVKDLQELLLAFARKEGQIKQAVTVTEAMQRPLKKDELMDYVAAIQRPVEVELPKEITPTGKPAKGETFRISLELFREGMGIDEIAATRNLKRSTIEGHLARFISSGEVDIHSLVEERKLNAIIDFLKSHPHTGSAAVKEALDPDFSYAEIKAALCYWEIKAAN